MAKKWLSLMEYSNAYGMSISTLRRRIRKNEIGFQQLSGKYYVEDPAIASSGQDLKMHSDHTNLSANLINELKSAFRLVLQEKEEQIYLLKEQIGHLNKLVNLLEEENSWLKAGVKIEKGRDGNTAFSGNLTDSL